MCVFVFWKCVCAFLHLSIVYSTITTPQFVQTDWKRTVIQNLQRSNFLNLQMILIIILSREKLLESPSILIRPSVLEIHWRRPSHNLQVKMFIILRRLYLRHMYVNGKKMKQQLMKLSNFQLVCIVFERPHTMTERDSREINWRSSMSW